MAKVNVNSIGDYIREQREQAKISMRQLAQTAGVSNPYLSQIERGLRKPSADILQQIAKGLRISAEALYVQAGILEDRPADSGVRSALLADPDLSERQKQSLIEIYESFRREAAAAAANADPAALPAGEFGLFEDEPVADESGLDGGAPGDEAFLAEAALAEGADDATTEADATGKTDTGKTDTGKTDTAETDATGKTDTGKTDTAEANTAGAERRVNGRKRSNVWAEAAAEQEPHDSTSD
jgi:transcriptional regulator with XRE-family HTH domain